MTETKETSMYTIIERHENTIQKHDDTLEDHGVQLRIQAEQIKQLQDNGIRLENVVMSENRETRSTVTETNRQLHDLIKGLMAYNSGSEERKANVQVAKTNASLAKWESFAKIIGLITGSSGVIYYIITKLL